jgi:branched-chain amino acid transport system substrate-binding protein
LIAAAGVIAVASVTVFAGSSSAHVAKVAKAKCTAALAIEAPLTGPVAQLGLEQLAGAKAAIANDNKTLGTNVTLAQDDTQLTPALATTKTAAIISSSAVGVIGPSGSQEVAAVGPALAGAGLAAISGSATNPALTTSGANTTFFRVVPDDNVQGPDDAHYIIKHKLAPAGSTILIVDDEEAYSEGITAVMIPILQAGGYTVNHQSYNGTDTGATLQSDLSSLATSQVTANTHLVILPWQSGGNAEQFGQVIQQQGKTVTLFGTDGTDSPGQFVIPGTYVSNFGPDISTSKSAIDKAIVSGVKKYGPYGAFGVPTWEATTVVMNAISSVCKSGKKPSRANVLAAVRKTNISATDSAMGVPIKFQADGDLVAKAGYLFHINSKGTYVEIPDK